MIYIRRALADAISVEVSLWFRYSGNSGIDRLKPEASTSGRIVRISDVIDIRRCLTQAAGGSKEDIRQSIHRRDSRLSLFQRKIDDEQKLLSLEMARRLLVSSFICGIADRSTGSMTWVRISLHLVSQTYDGGNYFSTYSWADASVWVFFEEIIYIRIGCVFLMMAAESILLRKEISKTS